MMDDTNLRTFARSLFDTGVRAADPGVAVENALTARPLADLGTGRHFVIAIGKAACSMMKTALRHLPKGAARTAIAVTNYENVTEVPGCTVLGAAHPVPDAQGLQASRMILRAMMNAQACDHVLFLISGGGSALLPAPLPGLTLADKSQTNELLLSHGFDITQTNLIRQQLSMFKGGGLSRIAAPAAQRTLAVSDVIGDDPCTIASGPTAHKLGTPAQAREILHARGVFAKLPQNVQEVLAEDLPLPEQCTPESDIAIICSNRRSLDAMAQSAPDWTPQILSDRVAGDVATVAGQLAAAAKQTQPGKKSLLIWGGETTVNIIGTGKGGRNQELALRFAQAVGGDSGDWVFLSGGTDGRDGPTDAAGGLVDPGTLARLAAAGCDPAASLRDNDSYHALQACDDLLMTPATGTNVADLMIFLRR